MVRKQRLVWKEWAGEDGEVGEASKVRENGQRKDPGEAEEFGDKKKTDKEGEVGGVREAG